jgi:hypothetical protein
MKDPRQASLFEDLPATGAELLRIDPRASSAKLSPAQQTFNRLTAQIEQIRAELLQFQALDDRLRERLGLHLQPALTELRSSQIRLLLQIDQLLCTPPRPVLKRRHEQILRGFLLYLGENLLRSEHPPEAELIEAFDRYSEVPAAELHEAHAAMQMEQLEDALGAQFGEELLKDHGARDAEELLRTLQDRVAAQAAGASEDDASPGQQQAPPRGNKRESAAAARKAQEQQQASLSVREIYRKLASSLHPDREADPLQRERKTELMQQINVAYQQADLLALLTLQMEVEQLNAASLAQLPEARLKHYNHVLKEQQQTLKSELQERTHALHQLLGSANERAWQLRKPQDFEREFERQLQELRNQVRGIESSRQTLLDPRRRGALIESFANEMYAADEEQAEAELLQMMSSMLQEAGAAAGPVGKRRRKR